jgi:hypothetical protein
MQPVVSTRPSLASSSCDLRGDAMCTTRHRYSTNFEANWKNPSPTCFQVKQAARYRCISRVVLLPSVLWHNRQTVARLVLRHKPRNRRGDFEAQITIPELPILRPKPENPSTLVLRPNRETRAPHLLVHSIDCTRCHPTSRLFDHRVPDLCLTIPDPLYQVSYSCLDPRRCAPCRTSLLHTMRQANMILHTR